MNKPLHLGLVTLRVLNQEAVAATIRNRFKELSRENQGDSDAKLLGAEEPNEQRVSGEGTELRGERSDEICPAAAALRAPRNTFTLHKPPRSTIFDEYIKSRRSG
jgi:hypothetical protein